MQTQDNQSQVDETLVVPVQDGDTTIVDDSQPAGAESDTQPGGEKALTAEEWRARESQILSTKDKEIETYRNQMAREALRRWGEQMQAQEAQAQARDKEEIDQGLITQTEAQQRGQQRMSHAQQQVQAVAQQAQMAQQMQAYQHMMAEAEQYGRALAARDIGEKYGVSPEELIKDQTLTSPMAMESKAANLALQRAKGELKRVQQGNQHFDQGQTGGTGISDSEKLKRRYPTMHK